VPRITVGIIDSGFDPRLQARVDAQAAFVVADGGLYRQPVQPDRLGHGSRVVRVIGSLAPSVHLVVAQVFGERLSTTPSQVAAALRWMLEQEVDLVNLSLGLRADRGPLRDACKSALDAGVTLCAATPARGEAVYPAAYPGVLRTTGDARCGRDEWSALNTRFADFGARVHTNDQRAAGASIGTAHLSGHIAAYLAGGGSNTGAAIRDYLQRHARYYGPERRTG